MTYSTLFIDIFLSEDLYNEFEPEWSVVDGSNTAPRTGQSCHFDECDDDPDDLDECDDDLEGEHRQKLLDEYEGFIHVHFASNLSSEILRSMRGQRHLVHLHRLKPLSAYSREIDFDQGLVGPGRFSRSEVLACLQYELKKVLGAPRGPVFYGTYNHAKDIVDDVRNHQIRWRRGVREEAEMLARQEVTANCPSANADRQSDPDAVGSKAWWAALKEDIARCQNGASHSLRICNVLDGLHGQTWQKWLERELGINHTNEIPH